MVLDNLENIRKKILDQLSQYPEDQIADIREQVENATDEELEEFILSQQFKTPGQEGDKCLFCEISSGNIDSIKIYEDNEILAILDIMPASNGHILVFPKKHFHFIQELEDRLLNKIMNFVKNISPVIVKTLNADGISIYLPQGQIAGQRVPHFVINVIPRYNEDKEKIVFDWQRERKDNNDLKHIAEKLRKEAQQSFKTSIKEEKKIEIKQEEKPKEILEQKKEEKIEEKKIIHIPRKIPN